MHLFTRQVTPRQDSSLTYANSRLKYLHDEAFVLQKWNKGLGDNCYGSSIRPVTKGPRVNSKKKDARNKSTFT